MTAEQVIGPGEAMLEGPLAVVRCVAGSLQQAAERSAESAAAAAQRAQQDEDQRLAALLRRVAERDEKALADFYDATMSRVYGLTLRITGRVDAAEEVAADAYLQVWRDAARYEPGRGRVLAWLLTICRSRAIDSIRRRDDAHPVADPERLRADEQSDAGDPQDLMLLAERSSGLHAALGDLNPLQRQLLALAFFRGLTHEEIAAHTRLPLGTVKTHVRRAITLLRARLAPGAAEETR
jgi:RNA polymerase sigma-70 factor (ECF subfamily)